LTQTGASTKTILEAVGVTDTAAGTTTSTTTTTTTPSVVAQTQETSPPNESASLKSKSKHVANTDTHDMKRSKVKSPTTNDVKEKHITTDATTPDDSDASSSCPSSSGSDDDDDDDDSSDSEDEAVPEETRRTRGRGKKRIREVPEQSTDSNDVDSPSSPSKSHVKANENVVVDVAVDKKETTTKDEETDHVKKPKKVSDPSKKTPKKDDKRRCIGRKPVTEFEKGKRYDGTVIYVKSFGAFVDIGSHSDAFVHISHVQDEFVKVDSISNLLEVGAKVSARVVEIDRTKKRITASLQSDEKLDAAEERKNQKMQTQAQTKKFDSDSSSSKIPMMEPPKTEPKVEVQKNEADMTPAELKRARKLARRADRREQKETTGISA
jgi:predicted RNA-binding protein with RPS1 domain